MRFGLAFLLAGGVGFLTTMWWRVQPTVPAPGASGTAALRAGDAGSSMLGSADLQPPPLNLPSDETCTDMALDEEPAAQGWTAETVRARLVARTQGHEGVELAALDCDEAPCVAWLLWRDGVADPALAYRWWSRLGAPVSVVDSADPRWVASAINDVIAAESMPTDLWTTSRSFPVTVAGSPDAMLQAVSVTPLGDAAKGPTLRRRVQERVDARLPALQAALAAP